MSSTAKAAPSRTIRRQGSPATKPSRSERAAGRRAAIIEAALEEFVARGFAATRLDDIAMRARVAKGTIYLHFKDKETLFEELVRTALVPVLDRLTTPPPVSGSIREALEGFAKVFIREVAATRRADIIRLIVAEGPRFPEIADFYYREVVSRGLAAMRRLIEIGIVRGEIRQTELRDFPQLVVAPVIVAIIWKSLFERHVPLDADEMFRVQLDLIFGARSTP
jgi:AcrR family transcriptional regulator